MLICLHRISFGSSMMISGRNVTWHMHEKESTESECVHDPWE